MRFADYYSQVKPEIDAKLSEVFSLEDEVVKRLFSHSTKKGKRFRPSLVVLSSDVLDGDHEEALNHAVVVEMLHTASLVHDDVIDGDTMRRKMPTLWRCVFKLAGISNRAWMKVFGKPRVKDPISMSVLAGDGLLARGLLLLNSTEAFHSFSNAIYALFRGAVREGTHPKEYKDKGFYYTTITLKTASLFATSTFLGALCSDAPREQKEALREFGKRLGILYQITDDYMDGDAPAWLLGNFQEELTEQRDKAREQLEKLPDNGYRAALYDVIDYMLTGLAAEGGSETRHYIEQVLES